MSFLDVDNQIRWAMTNRPIKIVINRRDKAVAGRWSRPCLRLNKIYISIKEKNRDDKSFDLIKNATGILLKNIYRTKMSTPRFIEFSIFLHEVNFMFITMCLQNKSLIACLIK